MRAPRVLVLALVVTALAVPVADAADETCHGQPATIVGAPGTDLTGTDGADVVVTNGASSTVTGAGDDLVCVTGGLGADDVDVIVEMGDDVVDTVASESTETWTDLGPGDDTYIGGSGSDSVHASSPWETPRGQGSDTISTGEGDDFVSTGGGPQTPDRDRIDLGPGADYVGVDGAVDPGFLIDGGDGRRDQLAFERIALRHALALDNVAGVATVAGEPVTTWAGFEGFQLSAIGPWEAPSFVGGDGPEWLWSTIPFTSVDLGAGDDRMNLELRAERVVEHPTFIGGTGDDAFTLYASAGDQARRAVLDLPAERLVFAIEQPVVHATIAGFERHRLSADQLRVTGTPGTDDLEWSGCHGYVDGGSGDDTIRSIDIPDVGCGYPVSTADIPVHGGPGNDVLVGGREPDVLLGGPGDDVAIGRQGVDRCLAEEVRRCE